MNEVEIIRTQIRNAIEEASGYYHYDIGEDFPKDELEGVEELSLDTRDTYCEITDVGLKELAKLQQLTILYLSSLITDTGLKELAKWKQLKKLNVRDTKVTKAGVAELQKALPECYFVHDFE